MRMALRKALAYSATLGVDAALRPRWAAALSRMAPFRTTSVEGVEVFAQSASFLTPDWNLTNATDGWPGTQHVYTRVKRAPLPWHLAFSWRSLSVHTGRDGRRARRCGEGGRSEHRNSSHNPQGASGMDARAQVLTRARCWCVVRGAWCVVLVLVQGLPDHLRLGHPPGRRDHAQLAARPAAGVRAE